MTAKRPYRIDFMPIERQEDADAFFDLVNERTPQGKHPAILMVHEPETRAGTMDELRNHVAMLLAEGSSHRLSCATTSRPGLPTASATTSKSS